MGFLSSPFLNKIKSSCKALVLKDLPTGREPPVARKSLSIKDLEKNY